MKALPFWGVGLLVSAKSFLLKLTIWSMLHTILKLFFFLTLVFKYSVKLFSHQQSLDSSVVRSNI